MRNMNELTNHWKDNKEKGNFDIKKMKEDMKSERVRKIKESKKGYIVRKDVCDQRFFRRVSREENP